MEFQRESEMLEPVARWARSSGLMIKTEVANPWGISDLVGCDLDEQRVAMRLALRQRRPIGPPVRVMILSRIPDLETGHSTTLARLQGAFADLVDGLAVSRHLGRLVGDRFVRITRTGAYQKVNRWFPLHNRLLAVELKLTRIRDALRQALANQSLTPESFVAFPFHTAARLLESEDGAAFQSRGIGVLGVTPRECTVLLQPAPGRYRPDKVAQTHCVEQFWRIYLTGN